MRIPNLNDKAPQILAVLVLLAAISGCGTGADSSNDASNNQKQLLATDLAELSSFNNSGAIQLDQQNNGVFTQVFGGTTGSDLTNFLNQRVHYYIDKDEDVSVTPSGFSVKGWTEQMGSDQTATENAENLSIEYWILGLINNVTVTFNFQDQTIPVTSPRTGIVLLDDGYSDKMPFDNEGDNEQVDMPSYYRQSILLHEARHSDCTGGLSQAQLGKISREQSASDFSAHEDAGFCGHLHVVCPSGTYQGLYACDAEIYGAYGVQDLFLLATELQLSSTGQDLTLIDAMQIDAESRLLGDNGGDEPDMSSSDVIQ